MENMLRVGVITSTHGVRGEVKVFPTTDDAKRFISLFHKYPPASENTSNTI